MPILCRAFHNINKGTALSAQIFDELERFFTESSCPVLFLGAGVSIRAGLPTWRSYVEQLAEGIRASDPLTTHQMYESVSAGDFPHAVEYFRLSQKMIEGEKRDLLARLLSAFNASSLKAVVALPARAFLTTNFDRSIFDALAKVGKTARDYKLGDASFKQAQWEESLFVARVHGAVEVPDGMVLSKSQFDQLLLNEDYLNLLRACFTQRNVLFLGFSFYDPAIRFVLDEINRRFGPAAPGRHLALLPRDATAEFLQRANRLNISVLRYDPADSHAELWRALDEFVSQKRRRMAVAATPSSTPTPLETTRKYLAACYARAHNLGTSTALREAIAEGIVSALLQEAAPKPIARLDVLERIRLVLGIRGSDVESLVDPALRALNEAGLCRRLKDTSGRESFVAWIGAAEESNGLKAAIAVLTRSCMNRAYLQEGWQADAKVEAVLATFFNRLVTRRGWDLGAAFALGRAPTVVSISVLIAETAHDLPAYDRERLVRVCQTLLQRPSAEESEILRELGRVSFALELAFQKPRAVLLQEAILPRSIYFDASVLMPAIVEGHPYSRVYTRAVDRLREAAASGAVELRRCVSAVYLNEIITHRRLAEDYANEIGGEFPDYARMDALYHGVTNVNVFVGAFASTYDERKESFPDFLARVAPYRTEGDLRRWLENRDFNVVDTQKGSRYVDHYQYLERAYASRLIRGKKAILIEHDALQLSLLDDELERGENCLFITADRALHSVTAEGPYARLTEMMLSHVALVQFIDLLLGGLSSDAGVTELFWSAKISDQGNAVRSYFTTRGLEQYDDAMSLEMPRIVERFAELAKSDFEVKGLNFETDEPRQRAAAMRGLGVLDKGYLENMREAAERVRSRLGD
jgi:hypothetical protein